MFIKCIHLYTFGDLLAVFWSKSEKRNSKFKGGFTSAYDSRLRYAQEVRKT